MKKRKKDLMETLKMTLFIFIGNGLLAFLVAAFIIPHDIIMGGTTGIAIVIHKFFPIEEALAVLILNVILLIIGLIVVGKKLFFTSIASSVLYPVMLGIMQRIPNIDKLTDDKLLASLYAGVLMGISLGLVMRVGSSTGGMDIANLVLAKLTHRSVALYVYITDILVVGGQAVIAKPEDILFGIVVLVLESLVLEQVMIFGKAQIQVYVVSERYEEIRKALLCDLQVGVTMHYIQTGALRSDEMAVQCILPSRKLYSATETICDIDPEAFITVTKIKEVRGHGFTDERRVLKVKE